MVIVLERLEPFVTTATNSMGSFHNISSIPVDRNFIDIEGPDGLVSYEDILRFLNVMRSMESELGTPCTTFNDKDIETE